MHLGDTVTWEAVHFGISSILTTKITAYERPHYFIDEMIRGIFQELKHPTMPSSPNHRERS